MAWDVLSRDVLSYIRSGGVRAGVEMVKIGKMITNQPFYNLKWRKL